MDIAPYGSHLSTAFILFGSSSKKEFLPKSWIDYYSGN